MYLFPAGGAEARQKANCEGNQEEDSGREAQAAGYRQPERGWSEVSFRTIKDQCTSASNLILSNLSLHLLSDHHLGKAGTYGLKLLQRNWQPFDKSLGDALHLSLLNADVFQGESQGDVGMYLPAGVREI